MPAYSALALYIPSYKHDAFAMALPAPIANASLYLNHAVLAGDLLGMDTSEALETINEVQSMAPNVPHLFIAEDLPVMLDFSNQVLAGLDAVADQDGKVRESPEADRLLASGLLRQTAEGLLMFESRSVVLADLREELSRIRDYFLFAQEQGLFVSLE